MLSFYLKSAVRSIGRKKVFSVLNIIGLGIGIGVFLLTLEYYSYETGFNTFHKNLAHLYRVNTSSASGKSALTVPNMAPMMQQQVPGIKAAFRFVDKFSSGAVISCESREAAAGIKSFREENCVFADRSFLDAFNFPFVAGTNKLGDPGAVVITQSVARKLFGNEMAVGRILQMHNQFGVRPFTISGIVKDLPAQSDIRFDYLFSIELLNNAGYLGDNGWAKLDNWDNNSYSSYAWLDDNANPQSVASAASSLWAKTSPEYKRDDGIISLQPLAELHLGNSVSDTNPTYGSRLISYFILGLGILILGIAWINYINFSTAFAVSQAKDIGIHKIIGSGKKQIINRYLTESLLLNVIGLVCGFSIVTAAQGLFNYTTGKPLSLEYINTPYNWFIGSGIFMLGVILCGGYVGIILAKFKPLATMRLDAVGSISNLLLRKGLVIFQFTVCILFITATIVAYRQLQFMKKHDLGMNIENLTVIEGPRVKTNDTIFKVNSAAFRNELAALPFVEKMSMTGSVPGIGYAHNFGASGITKENPVKGDEKKSYLVSIVDEHYFDTYGIPFLNGANFTSANADRGFGSGRVIINETAARQLGYEPSAALDQTIKWNHDFQVIGVVKDYHHRSMKEKIEPIIYIPQHNDACYTVKMNDAGFPKKISAIKELYEKLFPGNPFGYEVLKEAYDTQYADEERSGTVVLSVSVLVIVIACLGLIGLSVFTAKRRNKEIGIRKVLGASISSLFALLSKEFLLLVAIAFCIASPVAWYAVNKWLQDFAYRINADWTVFVLAGITTMTIALLTVSFQAIRAAMANPVNSLRSE